MEGNPFSWGSFGEGGVLSLGDVETAPWGGGHGGGAARRGIAPPIKGGVAWRAPKGGGTPIPPSEDGEQGWLPRARQRGTGGRLF